MRNERIGDYLVSQNLLTEEQLQQVLQAQKESNGVKKFGDVVVELGFMTEINFTKALAAKLRVQYVDLDNIEVDTNAVQKVPEQLARKHTVIAINIIGKRLTVATNDPVNFVIFEDIKVSTGMDPVPVLATTSAINKAIGKCYSMQNVDTVLEGVNAMAMTSEVQSRIRRHRTELNQLLSLSLQLQLLKTHSEPMQPIFTSNPLINIQESESVLTATLLSL